MTIAEHKSNIIRQLDDLPEESLCELEKIIAQLKAKSFNPRQFFAVSHLKNIDKQLEKMRNEWDY